MFSAPKLALAREPQRDFVASVLRVTFVALTASLFFVWLAASG